MTSDSMTLTLQTSLTKSSLLLASKETNVSPLNLAARTRQTAPASSSGSLPTPQRLPHPPPPPVPPTNLPCDIISPWVPGPERTGRGEGRGPF